MKHLPIIPWMGGKRRIAKHILPLFPEHQCYVEPFAGGAALFFLKEPSQTEVINDIDGELINLYKVVKYHLDELIKQFRWELVSREEFFNKRDINTDSLTDIQRAARFYYLVKCAFGGMVGKKPSFGYGPSSPPRMNLLRIEEDLSQAHLRLSRCFIENLTFDDVIKRYDRDYTLFYCDPPYYGTQGYGVEFPESAYKKLKELADTIKGKMVISLNDCEFVRDTFAGLSFKEVELRYTNGNTRTEKSGKAKEVIITNF